MAELQLKAYPYQCGKCFRESPPVDRTLPEGWRKFRTTHQSWIPLCPVCARPYLSQESDRTPNHYLLPEDEE